MKISIGESNLFELVKHQVINFFMASPNELIEIKNVLPEVLKRTSYCFSASTNKYYHDNSGLVFNPYHSGQYTIFLYFLANQIWKTNPNSKQIADKIYYLNKTLNGLDLFYEVDMPSVFFSTIQSELFLVGLNTGMDFHFLKIARLETIMVFIRR